MEKSGKGPGYEVEARQFSCPVAQKRGKGKKKEGTGKIKKRGRDETRRNEEATGVLRRTWQLGSNGTFCALARNLV